MNVLQKGTLLLIKSAFTGKTYELPDGFDLDAAVRLTKSHEILALLYYGASKYYSDSSEAVHELFNSCCKHIIISEGQKYELDAIFAAFTANGIDFLPLKGSILKKIYPKSEMRRMGDADILIREEQYDKIKSVLSELSFEYKYETDHEITWEKPSLFLELHKKVVPERNKDLYSYFGTGWDIAIRDKNNPYLYRFSIEMTMIFLFSHFAKHYCGGGIGISHMVDLWVYRNYYPDMDENFVMHELKKLHLDEFYLNISKTLDVWFDDAQSDQMTDFITDVIFRNGVYGTHEARILSYASRKNKRLDHKGAKLYSYLSMVFPKAKSLSVKYPILKKYPFFLPVMWVVRWFDVLIFKRKNIKKKRDDLKIMSVEKIDNYQKALNFVGLDFTFK